MSSESSFSLLDSFSNGDSLLEEVKESRESQIATLKGLKLKLNIRSLMMAAHDMAAYDVVLWSDGMHGWAAACWRFLLLGGDSKNTEKAVDRVPV